MRLRLHFLSAERLPIAASRRRCGRSGWFRDKDVHPQVGWCMTTRDAGPAKSEALLNLQRLQGLSWQRLVLSLTSQWANFLNCTFQNTFQSKKVKDGFLFLGKVWHHCNNSPWKDNTMVGTLCNAWLLLSTHAYHVYTFTPAHEACLEWESYGQLSRMAVCPMKWKWYEKVPCFWVLITCRATPTGLHSL